MSLSQKLDELRNELPSNVKLVAVSKFQPDDIILQAYDAGQRVFGENRPQELKQKAERLPKDIEWHFIGHLQTNKLKMVFPYSTLVHSIDSERLLIESEKYCERNDIYRDILLQVYIAQEETKFGFSNQEVIEVLNRVESLEIPLKHLRIRGLMAMASFTENNNQIRSEFEELNNCYREIKQKNYPFLKEFDQLSFGMTSDYKIAIEMGSTIVRIGTKIFGK